MEEEKNPLPNTKWCKNPVKQNGARRTTSCLEYYQYHRHNISSPQIHSMD